MVFGPFYFQCSLTPDEQLCEVYGANDCRQLQHSLQFGITSSVCSKGKKTFILLFLDAGKHEAINAVTLDKSAIV